MSKGKHLSETEKYEVVMALLRRESTGAELSRRYGVSEVSMYRWRDQFLEGGKSSLKSKRSSVEASELKQLRKEIAEHKQLIGEYAFANDFLKKKLERSL